MAYLSFEGVGKAIIRIQDEKRANVNFRIAIVILMGKKIGTPQDTGSKDGKPEKLYFS